MTPTRLLTNIRKNTRAFVKLSINVLCLTSIIMGLNTAYSSESAQPADPSIYPTYPKINYGEGKQAKLLKRGEYLVRVGDCISCHTDTKGSGAAFAGNFPLETPFGTFYSPNLTPDEETGLGKWTFNDFNRAMREGKRADGANLFPVFPYLYYQKLSDHDIHAIWAYLGAIPAKNSKPRKNTVPFPFSWRFGQYGWKMLFFYPHNDPFEYDPKQSPAWNRGAYLVEGLGHCAMCHTPLNLLGAPKRKYHMTGGFIQGYWAPNISKDGLASVPVEDVVKVFREGALPHKAGEVMGPMAEVTHNSLSFMTDDDLKAMAIYLKSIVSKDPMAVPGSDLEPTLARGKTIYYKACHTCHQQGREGAPRIGDAANWFERAKEGRAELYRHTIDGFNLMPIKGGCVTCSDNDIEAAVNYLVYSSLTRQQLKTFKNPPKDVVTVDVDGKEIYEKYCSVCHNNGQLGAPIIGEKKVWQPIIEKNIDVLLSYTLKGSDKKPPKGGCKYCNTTEIKAAIKYMVEKSKTKGNYSLW